MLRHLIIIILIGGIFFINSCKNDNPMLEKDKKILKEKLSSSKILTYKAIKVLFRSANFSDKSDKLNNEVRELSNYIYDKMIKAELEDEEFNIKDFYHVYTKYNSVKDELLEINEDDLPTMFEVILDASNCILDKKNKTIDYWCSSYEHLFLSVLLNEITDKTFEYSLYEVATINESEMKNNEIKALALIYKSMIFIEANLNYLAEDLLTNNIKMLEDGTIKNSNVLENKIFTGKNQLKQINSICYLMRGLARNKMKEKATKEKAMNDFIKFLDISEKNKLNNELSNIAGIYIYYKKGDLKTTLSFLKKLKKSNKFDSKQEKHIEKLISTLKKGGDIDLRKDLFSALSIKNIFKDYISTALTQSTYYKQIKKTEAGELLFGLPDEIYENYLEFNNVKAKGKEYFDKFISFFN